MAAIASRSLASEADEVDLGIPLSSAHADRTHGIEAAVAGLEGYDVECVRAVGSVAVNDIAGVGHAKSLLSFVL